MDPLSIAASIAGLVALSSKALHAVVGFHDDVKDAPKEVAGLVQELTSMRAVLLEFELFLRSKSAFSISFGQSSLLVTALASCTNSVESLTGKLQKFEKAGLSRALERFKWPFSEKETKKEVEKLRRYVATFQFALTVEGW